MNKTDKPKYQVVYLWYGERHRAIQTFNTMQEAKASLNNFLKDGWKAFIEVI